jgi:energy-coupling factor transporter ATP-binding protein EcfA2
VPFTPEDLVARGALGPRMMRFLSACVRGRANVMISGGTGSGKTTLLGVLSGFIADDERLITIEDAAQTLVSADEVGEPDRDEEGVPCLIRRRRTQGLCGGLSRHRDARSTPDPSDWDSVQPIRAEKSSPMLPYAKAVTGASF